MKEKTFDVKFNNALFTVSPNRPIQLTQCCTQLKSLGVKVLCVFHLHNNIAFTIKWYVKTWNKSFYSQRIWIGYNIELAKSVYLFSNILHSIFPLSEERFCNVINQVKHQTLTFNYSHQHVTLLFPFCHFGNKQMSWIFYHASKKYN